MQLGVVIIRKDWMSNVRTVLLGWGVLGFTFILCWVSVMPVQASWLKDVDDPVVEFDQDLGGQLYASTIPGYPCYRTILEINGQLKQWEMMYPDIANIITIGYSYESRPLYVMHLTRTSIGAEKPVFFLMANIHGNEIITNETAMIFIQYLLENYGYDPDVTWLLDEHDVYVMVSANPDGHVKNEVGEPWKKWRKNTNPTNDDCNEQHYGIDLNRNFDFKWGGAGSDSDPCGINYRGPAPASEYETQAIQTFMLSIFSDQRGPEDDDAAPVNATGLFISLHSYGNLVIWPWGYTDTPAPNASQLQGLGQKLATFTGYTPQQVYNLYQVNGATEDWAYGELGIASYVFEIGSRTDGHYPLCSRYDALVQPNVQALLYAAKVARTPYLTAFGPDTLYVTGSPTWTLAGGYIDINAMITTEGGEGIVEDSMVYSQTIAGAEVYFDVPPWQGGIAYPLAASDGVFDDPIEQVQGQYPVLMNGKFISGRYLIFVRGRDAAGNWGPVSADFITMSFPSLMPAAATQSVRPGQRVPYTLTLSNSDQVTHTFLISQSISRWPTTVVPTRVNDLAPDSYVTILVTVTVPEVGNSLLIFPSDVVTITAVAEDDPTLEVTASVLTSELYVEYFIFLPCVMQVAAADRFVLRVGSVQFKK